MGNLQGRDIILAGGTGGLGSATASPLAEEGANLVLSYRVNLEKAGNFRAIRADLSRAEDRTALLDSVSELYGLAILPADRISPRHCPGRSKSTFRDRFFWRAKPRIA
jgi:NAD(P)-dependent dehydrogenase (short-subunit alcohol dehydrogenase family)